MTGIIKVDTIQNNGGTTAMTIDSKSDCSAKTVRFFMPLPDNNSQRLDGTILPFGTVVTDIGGKRV